MGIFWPIFMVYPCSKGLCVQKLPSGVSGSSPSCEEPGRQHSDVRLHTASERPAKRVIETTVKTAVLRTHVIMVVDTGMVTTDVR